MRGEHSAQSCADVSMQGSSPHARGTHYLGLPYKTPYGIIPACAGNTFRRGFRWTMRRDHPRMRGEHLGSAPHRLWGLGSSPHARGTRVFGGVVVVVLGIIPACAGNTRRGLWNMLAARDHPRMRGEHVVERRSRRGFKGSSPHARGTLVGGFIRFCVGGIIPACAGNTNHATASPSSWRDHPRMRGEHQHSNRRSPVWAGSSPHARGTPRGCPRMACL